MSRFKRTAAVAAALTLLSIGSLSAQEERRYVDGRSAADENVPPFSGAVVVGDTL